LPEAFPAIDAGVVSVIPDEANGVITNRLHFYTCPTLECGHAEDIRIRKRSHILMASLTLCARAGASKAIQWKFTHMPVAPFQSGDLSLTIDCYSLRVIHPLFDRRINILRYIK
jgi:hypothetical protein